ncbi:hypothetical protein Scep_010299 [Stephania cephalantha]|uniref:Protein root UVB sensitive/RUS domain-containing protein n=1 Tax=Stephania cephalantha TaxID=152367 RepID=A0AAP0PD77_9MAGN
MEDCTATVQEELNLSSRHVSAEITEVFSAMRNRDTVNSSGLRGRDCESVQKKWILPQDFGEGGAGGGGVQRDFHEGYFRYFWSNFWVPQGKGQLSVITEIDALSVDNVVQGSKGDKSYRGLERIKMPPIKREAEKEEPQRPVMWIETTDATLSLHMFQIDSLLVKVVDDSRPVASRMVESFLNKFFPFGYPYSVNEGYLRYTQFRALQHFSSAALSVLSTQALLFAAGMRPTPAQATAVSWVLKDGMQHVGKLICSNLGSRMDSEPKSWRILADVLYDLGTGLEVLSPLCPHLFLEMAGLGNFAKGMAVVAARATRLPIYSSFAKEGNLSDLFAKGEAISTLFNVAGLGVGIKLASTICSSTKGKLVVGPLLSLVHIYSVVEEMRAAPVNTLNPQRTAIIVADFVKSGKIASPADLRYREDLLFPDRVIEDAGSVTIGKALHKVVKPSKFHELREMFPNEKRLVFCKNTRCRMNGESSMSIESPLRSTSVAAVSEEFFSIQVKFKVLLQTFKRVKQVLCTHLKVVRTRTLYVDQRDDDGVNSDAALI